MSDSPNNGMVQISARDLQMQRDMLTLFDKVWNDKDVGQQVRRKAKEIRPEINIPDDHPIVQQSQARSAELETKLTALDTAFNEYKSKAENSAAEGRLRNQLGEVQSKFGFTDEGMQKVIGLMQERQLADPEAAALLYRESIPKPAPQGNNRPYTDSRLDLYGTTRVDEKWEKLHTDPDGFFLDEVNAVFADTPPNG